MSKYEPTLETCADSAYRKYDTERQLSNVLKALEGMVVATSPLAESDVNVSKAREKAITALKEAGMHLINRQIKQGTIVLPELDMYDGGSQGLANPDDNVLQLVGNCP